MAGDREVMIQAKQAFTYFEPEKKDGLLGAWDLAGFYSRERNFPAYPSMCRQVVSRSGDECVVSTIDQSGPLPRLTPDKADGTELAGGI